MQAPDTKPLQTLDVPDRSLTSLPFMKLDVYVVARQLVTLVHRARLPNAELRDQATRASMSALLNLAEGLPSDQVGTRRRSFRSADGAVHEVAAALDCAAAIGALPEAVAGEGIALCARLRALIRGPMR